MKIDGMGASQAAAMAEAKKNQKIQQQAQEVEEKSQVTQPVEVENEDAQDQEKVKGVLRLLQAGHFKGVADVRLRINFYDEIQALEQQAVKDAAPSSYETFNASIQEQLTALKDSGKLSEDQSAAVDAFLENIGSIQDDSLSAENFSVDVLIGSLQGEFGVLKDLLTPTEPEPAAEQSQEPVTEPAVEPEIIETPVTDQPAQPVEVAPAAEEVILEAPVEEPQPVIEEAPVEPVVEEVLDNTAMLEMLNALQETFTQALGDLQSDLSSTSALPEISEPSGNGKAFDKFMVIYESMKNGESLNVEEADAIDFEEVIIPDESVEETV